VIAVRGLPEPLTAYRIGDPNGAYPIYSGEGSRLVSGRWHVEGARVIYASRHYSTAMLEKLAHASGQMPPNQYFIEIMVPAGVSYEVVTKDSLTDWCKPDLVAAQRFGAAWYNEQRSCILLVPSVVARMEENILINETHPDAARISRGLETPIWWDARLFAT
jgi:RES domain-containing protein